MQYTIPTQHRYHQVELYKPLGMTFQKRETLPAGADESTIGADSCVEVTCCKLSSFRATILREMRI